MPKEITPAQMMDEFRSTVLHLQPEDIGITKETYPHSVYALLMETGFPEGSFTLSSIADGSTSLYFSNGGGMVDDGKQGSVREASLQLLSGSQRYFRQATPATSYPKPEAGMVIFYFISFEGVRSYSALESSLGSLEDEFSDLFLSAHNVISEFREIDENQ